jgi:DNA-binding MarR family transcriptional regulator
MLKQIPEMIIKSLESTSIKPLKFLVLMSLAEMENIGVKAIAKKLLK